MRYFSSPEIDELIGMSALIDELANAIGRTGEQHVARQTVTLAGGDGDRKLLVMPAFGRDWGSMVKLATVYPDNRAIGLPTIQGAIVLFDAQGTPTAFLDGATVTKLRTGAASGLASRFLSRADSAHLVIIGTGALVPFMAEAHCAVRPITRISICGRSPDSARDAAMATRKRIAPWIEVRSDQKLDLAVAEADIVCCATSSRTPVFSGEWLRPGSLVDLVGNFSPVDRECDDVAISRSLVFVDTYEGALTEAGDLLEPMRRGVITRDAIVGDLAGLVAGRVRGRRSQSEITLFKSVGAAVEDFAAAKLIVDSASPEKDGRHVL